MNNINSCNDLKRNGNTDESYSKNTDNDDSKTYKYISSNEHFVFDRYKSYLHHTSAKSFDSFNITMWVENIWIFMYECMMYAHVSLCAICIFICIYMHDVYTFDSVYNHIIDFYS